MVVSFVLIDVSETKTSKKKFFVKIKTMSIYSIESVYSLLVRVTYLIQWSQV